MRRSPSDLAGGSVRTRSAARNLTAPVLLVAALLAPGGATALAAPAPAPTPAPPAMTAAPPAAPPPSSKVRVAIPEFQIEGGGSPALALQLQDGFVLGLVRTGVQVLDPVDMGRRLESKPELGRCDSSPCLKSIGQLLDVKYVVRVRVDVAGNSYKMVARLFSTEGATPAALPVANKSKSCDVCTVTEARDIMLRLADALRAHLEEPVVATPPPPPPPPPSPPSLGPPMVLAMVGALTLAAGFGVLASMGDCPASGCSENRFRASVGGALIGAGAVITVTGAYVTIMRSHSGGHAPGVAMALAWRW